MNFLLNYLLGLRKMQFPAAARVAVLNFLLQSGIPVFRFRVGEEVGSFLVGRGERADWETLGCIEVAEYGAPALFRLLLRRPGLFVGSLLGVLLLLLSSLTLWQIEVRGNERCSEAEIRDALAEAGLEVGAFVPGVDTAALKVRLLEKNPALSWVGIYLRGTTAVIEVREATGEDVTSPADTPANLVAAADAVIEQISVERGRAVVKVGQTVKRGDLLIGGAYPTASGAVCVRAAGTVRARVLHTVTLTQPKIEAQKVYGEGRVSELSLTFFGRSIKLFKLTGNSEEEYDIIKRKEQWILFSRLRLPIYTERCYRVPYRIEERVLDEEAMVRAAFQRMRAELAPLLAESELTKKRLHGYFEGDAYVLTCDAEAVVDIARPLPFATEKTGGES